MPACQTPIIVALDFPSRDAAQALADQLDPALCRVQAACRLCGFPVRGFRHGTTCVLRSDSSDSRGIAEQPLTRRQCCR